MPPSEQVPLKGNNQETPRTAWVLQPALVFPALIASSVMVIIVPLPAIILDFLLAANVAVAIIVLLTTVHVRKPLEFSVFPSVLLGTTLSRLVLNVASTRLILSHGATDGTQAAGGVIEAFGEFVAGGQIAIGVILFVILVVIQFIVITKGATRISEVAARFALDGMPGKQMAIDADLNAGLITPDQAKKRREEVAQQADFYGAMDGASKFVRGDAIAGIVITIVNICGGLYIGMFENSMDLATAASVFTILTIGDGLVSQVPAFLISLAAGLLVTRSSTDSDLSKDLVGQVLHSPQALYISALFLLGMTFTGMPLFPMLSLSGGCVLLANSLQRQLHQRMQSESEAKSKEMEKRPEPKPEDNLVVNPLELELGVGLLALANPAQGGDLIQRVKNLRSILAEELGVIMPQVRVRDSLLLGQRQYQVKIHDVGVAWGEVYPDGLLAIDTGATTGKLNGIATKEPAFGRPAYWIETAQKGRAELLRYRIADPSTVIVTHLKDIVQKHASELLSRQQVHQLLSNLKERSPKVVEELIPDLLKVPIVHQVLNNLLDERVPIKNLEQILEALTDYADRTKEPRILTEYVRHALSRTICQQYRDRNRVLHVVTLDPALEDHLAAGMEYSDRGLVVKLSPAVVESINRGMMKELESLKSKGLPFVVICSPQVRAGLRQITSVTIPELAVVSLNEITRDTELETHGQLGFEQIRGQLVKK